MQIGRLDVEVRPFDLSRGLVDFTLFNFAVALIMAVIGGTVCRLCFFVFMLVQMLVAVVMMAMMVMAAVMMMVMTVRVNVRVTVSMSMTMIMTMSRALLATEVHMTYVARMQYLDLDDVKDARKERN